MTTYTIKQVGEKYQVTIHMQGKHTPIDGGTYAKLRGAHNIGKLMCDLDNRMVARQEEYASR